ncbi:MAG: OmpA family protein [Deltaproteobacteria bacterium]|nr:OmpA family protein [Deltaproteobacteria bacterium]
MYFTNGSTLDRGSREMLKDVAALMKEYPALKLEVQGHVSPSGNAGTDHAVSTAQARSVAQTLMHSGVSSDRVTFRGYGSDFPVAPNDSPIGRARNQRIDLVLMQ